MRLLCWLLAVVTLGGVGHRWLVTTVNVRKSISLAHLHPMAGCNAVCVRCGAVWLDAGVT